MATITKLGPKYRTCESCHTRSTVGVGYITDEVGDVMSFHLCDRCLPADAEGCWSSMYEGYCPVCQAPHRGKECS